MADNKTGGANDSVVVTSWNACYNSGEGVISLSCTVTSSDSSAVISGVGLMLNDSRGITLTSTYAELSNDCESVTPALNIPPGGLKVGDTVRGVVSGEARGQHVNRLRLLERGGGRLGVPAVRNQVLEDHQQLAVLQRHLEVHA